MSRATWSQPLILKMKKTKSREMKLPPKTQSKFSGAKVESRLQGSQHASHSFSSNSMTRCLMFPWHLTEFLCRGNPRPKATELESCIAWSQPHSQFQACPPHHISYRNTPPWEYRYLNLSYTLGRGLGARL